jgi:hypothetical protein
MTKRTNMSTVLVCTLSTRGTGEKRTTRTTWATQPVAAPAWQENGAQRDAEHAKRN